MKMVAASRPRANGVARGLPRSTTLAPIAFGCVILCLPFVLSSYWIGVAFLCTLYAGAAIAWNIAGGFSGTQSFGQGLFFGIGAYTSTMLFEHLHLTPWIGLVAGAVLAGLAAAAIGWLGSRYGIGGLSFAILTLALAEMALLFVQAFEPLGASRGISISVADNANANLQMSSDAAYFWVGAGFLILCQVVALVILRKPLGYRFRAVRENELAARAMGINPMTVRMIALGISGALTAVAGTLYAQYLLVVNPGTFFGPEITIQVILFTVIGGLGTAWGPVIGTALLFPLAEWLRDTFGGQLPGLDLLLYGFLIMACVLAAPQGIVGVITRSRPWRRRKVPVS